MPARYLINSLLSLLIAAALVLTACSDKPESVRGFVLPEGDIAQGEQVFLDFNCHGCHTIEGKDWPEPEFEPPFIVELGGEVARVKNYGELLTAVVNPDHIITRKYVAMLEAAEKSVVISPMPYYGEEMTVAELIDLVAFLHAQYSALVPDYYKLHYPHR